MFIEQEDEGHAFKVYTGPSVSFSTYLVQSCDYMCAYIQRIDSPRTQQVGFDGIQMERFM
jgi:hypothetical protein